MSEIVGIWTGFRGASVLGSDGIDVVVDSNGEIHIRVEGKNLQL